MKKEIENIGKQKDIRGRQQQAVAVERLDQQAKIITTLISEDVMKKSERIKEKKKMMVIMRSLRTMTRVPPKSILPEVRIHRRKLSGKSMRSITPPSDHGACIV